MSGTTNSGAEYGTFTQQRNAEDERCDNDNVVVFQPRDPANPRNFTVRRKWIIVASITLIDLTVSWGASGFSPAKASFEKSFRADAHAATLGLSLYVLGLALGPMTLAPLSEYYGRTPLYVLPYVASVTLATFGGTIADLWPRYEVGPAMSLFLWAAVCGSPSGYLAMSLVAAATKNWRNVFWALLGICGGFWLIVVTVLFFFNNETRHAVLLRRRAARLRRARKDDRIDVPEHMKQKSMRELFSMTLSRPFHFLATELIIVFAALYNGLLYGISFLFNGAFDLVFGSKGYGFGTLGVGLCFVGFICGVSLGPVVNIWQEQHYQNQIRNSDKPPAENRGVDNASEDDDSDVRNLPEARVQTGKIAGILLPISLFWFAWTSNRPHDIHFIVPILATTLFGFSFYTLILMSYVYVEDSYMVFSASALAGVGLVRNLCGAAFPLFGTQMFEGLGYNWAGSVLAFMALLLSPIPFILERYGTQLRSRSPYAKQHMDDADDGRAHE